MFCSPVFAGRQVQVRSTPKPVTPFGGPVSLISFFERIGLAGRISEGMPFSYTSNNAIPPAQTLVAFLVSVVAGARRFAHTDWLRADKALRALLGIECFPGTHPCPAHRLVPQCLIMGEDPREAPAQTDGHVFGGGFPGRRHGVDGILPPVHALGRAGTGVGETSLRGHRLQILRTLREHLSARCPRFMPTIPSSSAMEVMPMKCATSPEIRTPAYSAAIPAGADPSGFPSTISSSRRSNAISNFMAAP